MMHRIILLLLTCFLLLSCAPEKSSKTKAVFDNKAINERKPIQVIVCSDEKLHYITYDSSGKGIILHKHKMIPFEVTGTFAERQKGALQKLFTSKFFKLENNVFCLSQNLVQASTASDYQPKEGEVLNRQPVLLHKAPALVNEIYREKDYRELRDFIKSQGVKSMGYSSAPIAILNAYRVSNIPQNKSIAILDLSDSASILYLISRTRLVIAPLSVNCDDNYADIGKEFKINFDDSRLLHKKKGFVGLGPTYEDPKDPEAGRVSEIIRKNMLLMSSEIQSVMNQHKPQTGKIETLYLCGSRSVSLYTENLFEAELKIPIKYVNFFTKIELGSDYTITKNREVLAENAHELGPSIGAALGIYVSDANRVKPLNLPSTEKEELAK